MEDVARLTELLEKHNPSAEPPSTDTLSQVFEELEQERIPYTAEMVKRARAQGETRVVSGVEACIARNDWYRATMKDEALLKARFGA